MPPRPQVPTDVRDSLRVSADQIVPNSPIEGDLELEFGARLDTVEEEAKQELVEKPECRSVNVVRLRARCSCSTKGRR
jgi:hypothetical protein